MVKREKVMRGLEACNRQSYNGSDCQNRPYYDDEDTVELAFGICNIQDMFDDALALLKEQEPRVMTKGDVLHSTGKPLWFESRGLCLCGKKGFWCLSFEVDPELNIRFVQAVTGGSILLPLSYYGKEWRAWDKCPTPEQMRETRWEGEKDAE